MEAVAEDVTQGVVDVNQTDLDQLFSTQNTEHVLISMGAQSTISSLGLRARYRGYRGKRSEKLS